MATKSQNQFLMQEGLLYTKPKYGTVFVFEEPTGPIADRVNVSLYFLIMIFDLLYFLFSIYTWFSNLLEIGYTSSALKTVFKGVCCTLKMSFKVLKTSRRRPVFTS